MSNEKELCSLCNRELSMWNTSLLKIDGKKVCSKCANAKNKETFLKDMAKTKEDMTKALNISKDGKCPKCGSDNIQVVTESDKKFFGVGKGLCGGILLGPIGLICGFCGNKNKTTAKRMCLTCGNKF